MGREKLDPETKVANRKASLKKYLKGYRSRPEVMVQINAYQRAYQNKSEQRRKNKNWHLKNDFGITVEQYDEMYAKQKGRCAICKKHASTQSTALCVDHNHNTGKVRGLLCHRCNRAIGIFNDSIQELFNAIKYLQKYDKA